MFGSATVYEDRTLLDFMMIEDVSIRNHKLRRTPDVLHASWVIVPQSNYEAYPLAATRNYREYQSGSSYFGQYWRELGTITWASDADNTWSAFTPIVRSQHTRQS